MKINIGLVDDHLIFLKSLGLMLGNFGIYHIAVQAANGEELQNRLKTVEEPVDIMLIDVNMPKMDGIATAKWMRSTYPATKLVALSMNDTERAIIEMIRAGCCAYLLKDTHPDEFEHALTEIYHHGHYSGDISSTKIQQLLKYKDSFSEREKAFLELACSDLTYKDIAARMFLSERTIDGYREKLFEKLNVQSRVGMALEAIRRNLVKI